MKKIIVAIVMAMTMMSLGTAMDMIVYVNPCEYISTNTTNSTQLAEEAPMEASEVDWSKGDFKQNHMKLSEFAKREFDESTWKLTHQ
jgi:nitric oxide reductase activation protein